MSEPFIGEIILFAGNFAPRGWAFCNGQILSIAQNTALFSILGTTYGGNGQTTFALPDLRGRVPVSAGQGPGLSPYSLGQITGSETVTLIASQMPAHTHSVAADAAAGTVDSPNGANLAKPITAVRPATAVNGYTSGNPTEPVTLAPATIGVAGGSQPHNNLQPTLALNYIIALEGIYPSRN
ncbi:phage tail protein [Methylobacterium nodulans]|uniref:Tail Collar domain protein n=1 Tax=Methylobacterium nodulans (strain LMG 21967 / CNCM I-2342 / ORS 2060) TaxID=460265 RepID=B8IH47_METNO|nr:tail fiber protein [Methylobacterium nodulans]ACL59739.1 Tail Collar domain protein [Methylobacterium nodulans ORS 2060]